MLSCIARPMFRCQSLQSHVVLQKKLEEIVIVH